MSQAERMLDFHTKSEATPSIVEPSIVEPSEFSRCELRLDLRCRRLATCAGIGRRNRRRKRSLNSRCGG